MDCGRIQDRVQPGKQLTRHAAHDVVLSQNHRRGRKTGCLASPPGIDLGERFSHTRLFRNTRSHTDTRVHLSELYTSFIPTQIIGREYTIRIQLVITRRDVKHE
jgi:hypothetical protein